MQQKPHLLLLLLFFKAATGTQREGEGSPVREGVPGQVQVGEVGAAASQQGPKQLAETEQVVLRD